MGSARGTRLEMGSGGRHMGRGVTEATLSATYIFVRYKCSGFTGPSSNIVMSNVDAACVPWTSSGSGARRAPSDLAGSVSGAQRAGAAFDNRGSLGGRRTAGGAVQREMDVAGARKNTIPKMHAEIT